MLHVPPGIGSVSAIVKPSHTLEGPLIADGNGLIVTDWVDVQPVDSNV